MEIIGTCIKFKSFKDVKIYTPILELHVLVKNIMNNCEHSVYV
jgi:hypothetical protein